MHVGQNIGYLYKMSMGADNWACANMPDTQQWNTTTSDPHVNNETKGDLVFGTAPVYPSAFQKWQRDDITRAHDYL